MVKKRVIAFFAMFLVFLIFLIGIQFVYFGKITGLFIFNLQETQTESPISNDQNNDFEFHILGYEKKENKIEVTYLLRELTNKEQHLLLEYSLTDSENKDISNEKEDIFVEKNSEKNYILIIPVSEELSGDFNLKVSIWGGKASNTENKEIKIMPEKITGLITSDISKDIFSNLGVFIISTFFVFLTIRFIYNHKRRIEKDILKGRIDRGLIKLELP